MIWQGPRGTRAIVFKGWHPRSGWYAWRPGDVCAYAFATWREAMQYANTGAVR